jgi:hypothetical protein
VNQDELNFAMGKASGDGGASAWFITASGGTAAVVTPRTQCGEASPDADTARRRQQASRPREAACRHPCNTQVVRAPENQHQSLAGDCGAQERSRRRSGERTMRRPDRHSRGAQLARWCRSSDECRLGTPKVRAAEASFLLKRQTERRWKTSI